VRILAAVLAVAAVLLSLTGPAGAEGPGSLVGSVRTSDGAALPHVAVAITGPEQRRFATGPDGSFRVEGLAPGRYTATVDTPGLEETSIVEAVVVDAEARMDIVLAPAPVRERLVVTATRGEAALSTLGVVTDILDRERIEARAASSLLPLLQEIPGVATARTGAVGQQASAFIRGGESRFARVLVDGVPVNQPGGAYDLGTVLPFELERAEVVRGATSSLYGTDALAGVVHLVTRRAGPDEPPSLRGEIEGGSFDWLRYLGGTSGAVGSLDWNAGVQRLTTDNEQPNSAFAQTAGALSLGLRLDSRTEARAVARLESSESGTPGPTAYGRPDLDASFERDDVTLSALLRRSGPRLTHELRLGYARTDQVSLNPLDSGPWTPTWEGMSGAFPLFDFPEPEGFQNQTARLAAGYQAEAALGTRHLLTAGVELEHETGELGNRAGDLLQPERTNLGAYIQDRLLLGRRAYLVLGARVERNGSFGTQAVPRVALAWRVRDGEDATTLRASAGMGIKEPSFFESYGESFFAKGNPDLDSETSTTFDVGVEQRLLGSRLRAQATFFHHDYRDQIAFTTLDFTTFEGTYVNLAHTRARGIELSLETRPAAGLALYGQYTWLDGEILESPSDFDPVFAAGEPLLRRPEHQAALTAEWSGPRLGAGATLVHVGRRADSDFVGLGLGENEPYTRLDARLRLRIARGVEAFLVTENLLDREYQEVLGYPAPGRSVRAGVRLAAGGRR
jgi:outer membrane cobalamin receptor